ncbi:MAG TPA: endonuclease/exonuclease/phosphatase family protein [Catenuloplanes sp.]|jgi:endonuclease/exonuclease/phosphatase (EEP) superfamily protein YafD
MTVDTAAAPRNVGRAGRTPAALCWLAVLPAALWAVVRVFGVDHGPLVQLLAFTPYVAAWALVPAVLAVALRQWRPAAVAVLAAVALIGCVAPRAVGGPEAPAGGPPLRVLTANLLVGGADAAALVTLVREHRVDLLAVQEFTAAAGTALQSAGLTGLLPHRQLNPEDGTTGSGLYSRLPLRDGGVRRNGGGFTQAYATVEVPGGPAVLVESVHPLAPYAVSVLDDWRADLDAQPRATAGGPVRLLLGDFNATLDHAPLRRLIASGYVDAADTVGAGLTGTWGPYDGDLIPPVTIDHVLVDRRVTVQQVRVFPLAGSDHRPVLAALTLPAG